VLSGPTGWRARHWRRAIRAVRLEPLRPHDLRHTAASLWVAAGASPKQIATWAGHTSVSVVLDRYGHLFPGHEEAVLDRLDSLIVTPPLTATTGQDPRVPRVSSSGTWATVEFRYLGDR
jgi:integrase